MTETRFEWIVIVRPDAKHAGPYVDLLDDFYGALRDRTWPPQPSLRSIGNYVYPRRQVKHARRDS